MTKLSRKELIINEYLRMSKKIEIKIDRKIPIIDDSEKYDFIDIITLFNYQIHDITDSNHKEKIDIILNMLDIDFTQLEKDQVYEYIYDYIKWFKNLH